MQSSLLTPATAGFPCPAHSSISPNILAHAAPPNVQQPAQRPDQGRGKWKLAAGFPTPPPRGDLDNVSPSRKRKNKDPNWSREEILALVEAKKDEYMEKMEVVDARDLMATDVSKWGYIAEKVNSATGGAVI